MFEHVLRKPVLSERGPGDEGNAVLRAVIEEEVPLAIGEAIPILHGHDGDDLACALEVLKGHVGQGDVADLSLLLQAGQCFHRGVEGDRGVGNVELVDVDAIEMQAGQAAFDRLFKMFGAGVVNPLARTDARPSTFGGDHQTDWIGSERFGNQLLGDIGAIGVGGVDEVDSKLNGATQCRECSSAIVGRSPDAFAGEAHGAVTEAVDGEIAELDGAGGSGRECLRCHLRNLLSS